MAEGRPGIEKEPVTSGLRKAGPMEWALALGLLASCGLGVWAVANDNWSAARLGPLFTVALGAIASVSVVGLLTELRRGQKPEVKTHWGGLGGGLGGWSMSPAMVYFALALLFGGGAFVTLQTTSEAQTKHLDAQKVIAAEAAKAAEAARLAAVAAQNTRDLVAAEAAAKVAAEAKARADVEARPTGASEQPPAPAPPAEPPK